MSNITTIRIIVDSIICAFRSSTVPEPAAASQSDSAAG